MAIYLCILFLYWYIVLLLWACSAEKIGDVYAFIGSSTYEFLGEQCYYTFVSAIIEY